MKSRRWLVPVVLSALLLAWQSGFGPASHESRRAHAMTASMGLCPDVLRFFYFFHHFGVFPVGSLDVPRLGASKLAASEYVKNHGDRLVMDFGWPTNTPRFGDYAKLFLFYPDLWLRADPAHPSATPFNVLLFNVALLAVLWAFWHEGYTLLGVLIVVLVGSDPFQVLETYARGNVFTIPISVALLALAAHLRFVTRRQRADAWAFGIAIVSALALTTLREVRAEAGIMAGAVVLTYLCARGAWPRRLALVAVFVVAGSLTSQAWSRYWAGQFTRAEAFVARAGGQVFRAPGGTHHAFWHAIYCGLGDYGGDRGFSWDDRAAFRWATTYDAATNPKPLTQRYVQGYYLEDTYDGVHHVAPTDLPEYNQRMRERVLSVLRAEPLWYAGVLGQRMLAIPRDATPAALSFGAITLALPGVGWLTLPVLLWACWRRRWFHAALIAFTLPLSALALLVYSGRGMTYYGIAHLVALAVAIDLVVRARTSQPTREPVHVD
ncbi:MAG: hypothetical protein ABL977_09240 [Candidatus Eisenbacteria bacterium]